MNLGDYITELYRTRTDAYFQHMQKKCSELEARSKGGEQISKEDMKGYSLAAMLLSLRAMEIAEQEVLGKIALPAPAESRNQDVEQTQHRSRENANQAALENHY